MVTLPTAFFITAFVLTVLAGLITAPFMMFTEERQRRRIAEALRVPRYSVGLPDTGTVNVSVAASTVEALSGKRQTIIQSFHTDTVCLICRNEGEVPIHNCRARVLSASRVSDDGSEVGLDFIEPIELPWKKEEPEASLSTDLGPLETRRIWVGGVRSRGYFWVFREIKRLAVEAQQVFGPPGVYRILVQIDSDDAAPLQTELRIKAAEGPKPEQSGVWRGMAEVSILAQGSPTIPQTQD